MVKRPNIDGENVVILSLDNLDAALTETTFTVWCDFAERVANTNHDGYAHFCQYCGSTDHEPIGVTR